MNKSMNPPEFDTHAQDYEAALGGWVNLTGENKEYYAKTRLEWLSRCLRQLQYKPNTVLDFGCGIGISTPFFFDNLSVKQLIGVDVSQESLNIAHQKYGHCKTTYKLLDQFEPNGDIDLAFCNGVFHHINPEQRPQSIDYVHNALKPDGYFAVWENNYWNPAMRYAMNHAEIDRNAIPVAAPTMKQLLNANGFKVITTSFLFIFPRILGWFRGLEALVSTLPIGAQYQVLAQKI